MIKYLKIYYYLLLMEPEIKNWLDKYCGGSVEEGIKKLSYYREYDDIVEEIAQKVYREMGSGHNESLYRECMAYEFRKKDYKVGVEVSVPIVYDGSMLSYVCGRLDIILDDRVIIELKAVSGKDMTAAKEQCKLYMRMMGKDDGYIINFVKGVDKEVIVEKIKCD